MHRVRTLALSHEPGKLWDQAGHCLLAYFFDFQDKDKDTQRLNIIHKFLLVLMHQELQDRIR